MFHILQHVSIAIAEVATLSVVASSPDAAWLCGLTLLVIGRSMWSAAAHIADCITEIPRSNLSTRPGTNP